MMNLSASQINESIINLFKRCIQSAPKDRAWSIAELQMNSECIAEVEALLSNLSSWQIRSLINNRIRTVSGQATMRHAFGFLLLAYISESARREASEGTLWSAVYRKLLKTSLVEVLFTYNRQPTSELKQLLEDTCRILNLRHVFGIEGHQNWMVSVYLQFGFTKKGFERRLAEWLSGQLPSTAIHYLAFNGRLRSSSFHNLWSGLLQFRQRNMQEANLRRALSTSPWILPDWIDELIVQCQRKLANAWRPALDSEELWSEPAPPDFLEAPRFLWEVNGKPSFQTKFVNLADFDLFEPRYLLYGGKIHLGDLVQQDNGMYQFSEGEVISLALTVPQMQFYLRDIHGNTVAQQEMTLWDPFADIQVIGLKEGKLFPNPYNATFARDEDWALLVPSDLEVRGDSIDDAILYPLPNASFHCYRFFSGNQACQVTLEGDILWEPSVRRVREAPIIQVTLKDINVSQKKAQLAITLPSEVKLLSVQRSKEPLAMMLGIKNPNRLQTLPFELHPHEYFSGIEVSVRVKTEQGNFRIKRIIPVPFEGMAWSGPYGNIFFKPLKQLYTDSARDDLFKLSVLFGIGSDFRMRDFGILEGNQFVSRATERVRPLGKLDGYGAPLSLRKGPYNAVGEEDHVALSSEVIDRGLISGVKCNESDFVVRIHKPIAWTAHHAVLLWFARGGFRLLTNPSCVEEGSLKFEQSIDFDDLVCVGLVYKNFRIGSYWNNRLWSKRLDSLTHKEEILEAAQALRFLKAPILSSWHCRAVRSFLREHFEIVLPLWLSSEPLKVGEIEDCVNPEGEGWRNALGELIGPFGFDNLDAEKVCAFIESLAALISNELDLPETKGADLVPLAFARIIEYSPRLCSQLMAIFLQRNLLFSQEREELKQAVMREVSDEQYLGDLVTECAESIRVHRDFLNDTLAQYLSGQSLSVPQLNNIRLLLTTASFRRLVILSSLHSL